ncbi:MAG: lytic polysaccharide monooxygenase [Myxococcales bacterium]|nr:lytic polysaccharide monooxygenase [Myxococcales bacterium]
MIRRSTSAFALLALTTAAAPAHAHFVLVEPESYAEQSFLGDPQKNPPCGQFDEIAGPTGEVTTYVEGSTIDIVVSERIFHPGHYRVAIAETPEELPEEPPVTAGTTDCGSTVIDPAPALPVLADGELLHDSAFTSDQTFSVQLPPGFTCENCTLQVIEFMSNHPLNNPGGCFYHHCATVSIVPAGAGDGEGADAGEDDAAGGADASGGEDVSGGPDAATEDDASVAEAGEDAPVDSAEDAGTGGDAGGGGCSVAPSTGGARGGLIAVLAAAAFARGRRRRPCAATRASSRG